MLVIANPAGILICGSTPKMDDALGAGLRRRIVEFVKNSSGEDGNRDEGAKVHLIASARLAVKVFCSGSEWLGSQVALERTVWKTRI
jgi:hypothetical protein